MDKIEILWIYSSMFSYIPSISWTVLMNDKLSLLLMVKVQSLKSYTKEESKLLDFAYVDESFLTDFLKTFWDI